MNKKEKIETSNKMIKIISDHGRRFFYYRGDVGYFKTKNKRLYFVDEFTKKEIYLYYRYWSFHHGGTLRALVNALKEYIMNRAEFPLNHLGPWPEYLCGGDPWGYGKEMETVRNKCAELTLTKKCYVEMLG